MAVRELSVATQGSASVHVRTYSSEQVTHSHHYHQVILPLCGSLELEVRGHAGMVSGLSGALVPAGEQHAFAGNGSNRVVVLDLSHGFVEEVGGLPWLEHRCGEVFFTSMRARLFASLLAGDTSVEQGGEGVHRAWATLVLRAAIAAERSPPRDPAIERSLLYIRDHAAEPLEVADIALAAGVSKARLHALFRDRLGRSPRAFLLDRRLELAQELLADGDLPIVEVALRCGFADQPTLTHAMRRVLGTTPGTVRRSRRRDG